MSSMLFSMEKDFGLSTFIPQSIISQSYTRSKTIEEIFATDDYGKAELYGSKDECNITVGHQDKYTYYNPGYVDTDFGPVFPYMRRKESHLYRYPGLFVIANGPVQRNDGLPNGFNWKHEAKRHLKVLYYLLKNNTPVECWQSTCYGFWAISSTLYALASGTRDAVELRGELFIPDYEAFAILEKLKLIIVSAPLLSTKKMLNKAYNPLVENVLLSAATVPAAVNIGQSVLCNNPIQPSSFFYYPLMSYFKSSVASVCTYYGMKYRTSIDEKKGEGLQLLYDLSKQKIRIPATCMVTWQKEDKIVDTVDPEDLIVLHSVFDNIVGIGSPYEDHVHDDMRQRRLMNFVRKEHGMPHYNVPELLATGEKHYNEIKSFHELEDWKGLKLFSEDQTKYIL
ncbi:MAG TPA: hypothetical protein VL201_03805 [Patescibacteria group bacterium]|jgi:hypothetical protein|nr:hypothetical protein [Patescibacteria group bacterium]